MSILKSVGDFFALDIGTNAIRVAQLSGGPGRWSLIHYGYATVHMKDTTADSKEAERRLGESILTAIGQSGIKTKNVVVGIPAQKSFTTIIDMPHMPVQELKSTIKYQIDKYVPMSIDEAKIDWVSLGQSQRNPNEEEILISSTANSYVEQRLEMLENLGLNVVAMEPEPIAMIRSLLPSGVMDAWMILDVGELATNLVVVYQGTPRLVRAIPTGLATLTKSAAQNLNVQEDQARQFIVKFGLAQDKLEGQVVRALDSSLDSFIAEVEKSVKFFQTRYPEVRINGAILGGFASTIPFFGDYITAKTGLQCRAVSPLASVAVAQADQQQLAPVAAEFAVVLGLAERGEDA